MGAPQIITIALWIANFIFVCYLAGQPKKGTYDPISTVVTLAINYWILSAGGFFVTMGIPQIIILVLWGVDAIQTLALAGVPRKGTYNPLVTLIGTGVSCWLLIAGGFFK